jgi:hypothetical protein
LRASAESAESGLGDEGQSAEVVAEALRARVVELETELQASYAATVAAREAAATTNDMHTAAVKDVMAALAKQRDTQMEVRLPTAPPSMDV